MALEEEFDVEVPEEELEGIETVGQAYDLVAGKLLTVDGPRPPGRRHRPRCRRPVRRRRGRVLGRPARARRHRRRPRVDVADWDPSPYYDTPKEARRADRGRAVRDRRGRRGVRPAGGPDGIGVDPARFGTIFGTGVGGLHTLEEQVAGPAREGRAAGLAVPRADDDGERRRRGDLDALTACRVRTRRSAPRAPPAPTPSATPPGSSPGAAATPSSRAAPRRRPR